LPWPGPLLLQQEWPALLFWRLHLPRNLLCFECMKGNHRPLYILMLLLALVVNFSGLDLGFFTDDPGLYASIAKNLVHHREFLELFTYNQDWLDKPHFPFWAVMASFKVFGISVWAYRLPALFFFLLSLLYTWLFTKKHYGEETAWVATLILATAQHVLMSNTDVRAEPYLMGLVMGAVYYISRLYERYALADLLLASLFTACAIMTKGIFVMVAIYGALLGQLVFQGKFGQLFQWKWIILFILTAIFILPEIYALYVQFDSHPEKTVFHKHNVSGIRWFLWDSQFGRFVNKGAITRQSGSIFFYMHTLLWAFAPWCLLFYYAISRNIRQIVRGKKLTEYYSISGGLLLLLLFSLSRFQLPFYTNTIFPLFAILTAPLCLEKLSNAGTWFRQTGMWLYIGLLFAGVIVLQYLSSPGYTAYFIIDLVIFAVLIPVIIRKAGAAHIQVFCLACAAILFANFYLNTVFYKLIINYRGQIKAADYTNQPLFNNYHFYTLKTENNVYQFYSKHMIDYVPLDSFKTLKATEPSVFYVNKRSMDSLRMLKADFKEIKAFENYPQENILPAFIDKETRPSTLDSVYLITK
jgi:4-amino-4-deoxy-L-arabinose transferase-like glycosyltransferase